MILTLADIFRRPQIDISEFVADLEQDRRRPFNRHGSQAVAAIEIELAKALAAPIAGRGKTN